MKKRNSGYKKYKFTYIKGTLFTLFICSVVLAKSIPAKSFGITTGEPVVNAFRKCPGLVAVAPDQELYHQRSRQLMTFLRINIYMKDNRITHGTPPKCIIVVIFTISFEI